MQQSRTVYTIDHTMLDLFVNIEGSETDLASAQQVRPWLTICYEPRAHLVVGSVITTHLPDDQTLEAILLTICKQSPKKPYGGLPDEIALSQRLTHHIQAVLQHLSITLSHPSPSYQGSIERFFRTCSAQIGLTLSTYHAGQNPLHDVFTLFELEHCLVTFLEQYHRQFHSQINQTPLAYWEAHCHTRPIDPDLLERILSDGRESS